MIFLGMLIGGFIGIAIMSIMQMAKEGDKPHSGYHPTKRMSGQPPNKGSDVQYPASSNGEIADD